jgi:hypothetical protein
MGTERRTPPVQVAVAAAHDLIGHVLDVEQLPTI